MLMCATRRFAPVLRMVRTHATFPSSPGPPPPPLALHEPRTWVFLRHPPPPEPLRSGGSAQNQYRRRVRQHLQAAAAMQAGQEVGKACRLGSSQFMCSGHAELLTRLEALKRSGPDLRMNCPGSAFGPSMDKRETDRIEKYDEDGPSRAAAPTRHQVRCTPSVCMLR